MPSSSSSLTVGSGDVLRLIQAHLTENGLHESCKALRDESGVLGAGACHNNFSVWALQGKWGTILESLSSIDASKTSTALMADVHEMTILELGDVGETELAHATLRLVAEELDRHDSTISNPNNSDPLRIPRSRLLEQKLLALVSRRVSSQTSATPPDYYNGMTQQARRVEIGKRLAEAVPVVPPSRLLALIQQSIKWQSHTGLLPTTVQQQLQEELDQAEKKDDKKDGTTVTKKKRGKRKRKEFDLVLGEVDASTTVVGEAPHRDDEDAAAESIPSKAYSIIKFGKKATAESAIFLPDASGLVTGSSDGLIEIWDSAEKFSKLRLDLDYQQNDEFMWHDHAVSALTVSNDGEMLASGDLKGHVKVWRITTGKCLRDFRAHEKAISCVAFSHDGSHVLTGSHDGTCREFGLRASRMLKEFHGHGSFVNTCCYHMVDNERLFVVTGSADGTMRVWDGKSAESLRVMQPRAGVMSAVVDAGSSAGGASDGSSTSPSIHSVIPLHKVPHAFLVAPRGPTAFMINQDGDILKTFESGNGKDIVAATVSPSNRWLYAATEDGVCRVFDMSTGQLEQSFQNFGTESTATSKDMEGNIKGAEISALVHHPHKGILAAFSNDKGQKRGLLTLWK